jgi:hypothetical protein
MNPEYYKEAPGVYHQASGGLDFNRNLMRDRYGIKEVETPVRKLTEKSQFGTAQDPILPVIEQHVHNHDPKKWQQIAHDVRTSGKESQEAFKLEFLNILKGEEKAQKLKALLMHGAPGVALGALSIPQVRGALGRVEQATADKLKEKLSGDDFTLQNPHTLLAGMGAAGLGTSAAVSGALANSYGNRLQALTEALRKNPSHLSDPKKVAKYFQEYADIMKRAQNLPLGGVLPARVVTSALSPSQLSKDPLKELQYRLSKMVPGVKLPAKEHAAHLDMEKHYKGFQTNPEQTLASEIANKNLSTVETRDISQVLSPRTVKDILVRKGVSIPANLKDNQLYELARTHNIRTLSDVIPQDSLRKFLTGDARNMTQRLESLKGVHKGVLSDILRHRAKIMLGPTEQAAATQYGKFMNNAGKLHMYGGGALAGVGGLMSLLSFMRNKKKNEGVQNA